MTRGIPVLQLSADAQVHEPASKTLEGAPDATLPSPFEPVELLATVRGLIRVRGAEERVRSAARQWKATFDAISDGVCLLSPQGVLLRCNRALSTLLRKSFGEVIERPLAELLPELDALKPGLLEVGGAPDGRVTHEIGLAGRWFRVTVDAALDEQGVPAGFVCVFTDLTERKRSEEQLAFLARASGVLSAALDVDLTLGELARLAVPVLGDWCFVDLVDGPRLRRVVQEAGDERTRELVAQLAERYPVELASDRPLARVVRTGEALLLPDVDESALARFAPDDGYLRIARELRLRSGLVVPIPGRDRILGTFSLGATTPGRYDAETLALARELGQRAGLAIENARLFRSEQQAREELRLRAAELESIFGLVPMGIAITHDRDARRISVNRAMASLLGIAAGTNASLSSAEGDPPPYRVFRDGRPLEPDDLPMQRAAREGVEVIGEEIEVRRPDGSLVMLVGSALPFRDDDGKPAGAVAAFVDITHRKASEGVLRATNERLRSVLESITDSFLRMDDALRVEDLNHNMAAFLGHPRHELVGRPVWEVLPETVDGEVRRELEAALAEGRPRHFETASRARPGRWLEVHAHPDAGGLAIYVRDISHRKESEEALRRSEERFRSMADSLPQLVWSADASGRLLYVNARWRSFFGLDPESFPREGWLDLVHPDDRAAVSEWRERLAQGRSFALQLRLRRHDGSWRWHLQRAVPVRDAQERVLQWVGAFTDIEDQKRGEERLRFIARVSQVLAGSLDPETTLASVAELAVPDMADWCGVDVLEDDGGIRNVAIVHGDPEKMERARTWRDRFPLDPDAPRGLAYVLRTGRTEMLGEIPDAAIEAAARDAEQLRILKALGLRSYLCVPMVSRGRVLGAISFVTAESDRRYGPADLELAEDLAGRAAVAVEHARLYEAAQEAFRAERERAAQLRGTAAAAVAINSALTAEEVLEVITDQARRIVGAEWCVTTLTPDEPHAQPLTAVSRSDRTSAYRDYTERPGSPELYARLLRESRPLRFTRAEIEALPEWDSIRASSRHPAMQGWMAVPLLGTDGHHIGAIQLSDKSHGDFTEDDEAILVQLAQLASVAIENAILYHKARRAEDDLRRHAAELSRRVDEKTRELRETNRQLEAFSYSVAHNLRSPLRAMRGFAEALLEEYGPALDANARSYGSRMIGAATQMDRLIQDLLDYSRIARAHLVTEAFSVQAAVADVLATLRQDIEDRNAQVIHQIPEDLPAVLCAPGLLSQILTNLIGNALKFVAPGVRPRVVLGAQDEGGRVRVWVRDNGIGIPDEYQQKVFQEFERLHRHDEYPGTGVGLAMVRMAASRFGGDCGVESTPGKGSTFWFELPAAGRLA